MSIQIDDGEFTRLHNKIFEKLALAHFTAYEYKCLMFLFRKTYGWHKKEDVISYSQWEEGTGIQRANARRTLQGLVAKRVVLCKLGSSTHPATWGFNKNFDDWDASLFESTVVSTDSSSESTVVTPDYSAVVSTDSTTVVSTDSHKRKERKIKDKKIVAAQPTPQQEMFAAVCEAIGWDYKTLSKDDKGQVAQFVGVLSKNNYSVDDIHHFITDFWFKDWRWAKDGKLPTLKQLRQEIGIIRSTLNSVAPASAKKGVNGYFDMLAEQGIDVWQTK